MTSKRDAKSLMGPRIDEIHRRKDVAESSATNDVQVFERVRDGTPDPPYVDAAQGFVLFSLSSEEHWPRCKDPRQPAIKVWGAFPSRAVALDHAAHVEGVLGGDAKVNFMVSETHRWIVACRSPARTADPQCAATQLQCMLSVMTDTKARDQHEFDDNVKRSKSGSVLFKDVEDAQSRSKQDGTLLRGLTPTPADRNYTSTIPPKQNFSVVCFLPDRGDAPYPEFAFCVLRCCDTEKEADRYIRNVAAVRVMDHDIHVVDTGSWNFPQMLVDGIVPQEKYRNAELDKVMSSHRTSTSEAQAFAAQHGSREASTEGEEVCGRISEQIQAESDVQSIVTLNHTANES
tara:strand:- start:87 stop:1121 length:1035 start_codon:yes stop_codon:yes gene_type:complete